MCKHLNVIKQLPTIAHKLKYIIDVYFIVYKNSKLYGTRNSFWLKSCIKVTLFLSNDDRNILFNDIS